MMAYLLLNPYFISNEANFYLSTPSILKDTSEIDVPLNEWGLPDPQKVVEIMRLAVGDDEPLATQALATLFEIFPGPNSKNPVWLVTLSVGKRDREELIKRARQHGMSLYILKPHMGPLALSREYFIAIVRKLKPRIIRSFVDETYGEEFWDSLTTPDLKLINQMARGTGNLHLEIRERLRSEVKIGYLAGQNIPLRLPVAENVVAKVLFGWFRLQRFKNVEKPTENSLEPHLKKYVESHPNVIAQFLLGQLLRQAKQMDKALRFVREDQFRGCGNGKRTVPNFQLGKDLRVGIKTTVGIIGSGAIIKDLARLVKGFEVADIYYTGERLTEREEKELSLQYVGTMDEFIERSDFVVKCPSAGNSEIAKTLIEKENENREYDWLVDTSKLVSVANYSSKELGVVVDDLMNSSLANETIGIFGLGAIGKLLAERLRVLTPNLVATVYKNPHEDLKKKLGIQFVE